MYKLYDMGSGNEQTLQMNRDGRYIVAHVATGVQTLITVSMQALLIITAQTAVQRWMVSDMCRLLERKSQIMLYVQVCEACVFGTETDIPHGLIDNYLYCELNCWLTILNQRCPSFIPKRKYNGKVAFYITQNVVIDMRLIDAEGVMTCKLLRRYVMSENFCWKGEPKDGGRK